MSDPKPAWHASPAGGVMLAKLFELYARALRVDATLKARRMERLANLVTKKPK